MSLKFAVLDLSHCNIEAKVREINQTKLNLIHLFQLLIESAGIVTSDGDDSKNFYVHKGMGMINNIFTDENIKKLKGNLGIGHTRYSTSAASTEVNCQPFVVHTVHGPIGEIIRLFTLQ
jgi:glutamine phosphoribosylpyrophosphate amidotransferase